MYIEQKNNTIFVFPTLPKQLSRLKICLESIEGCCKNSYDKAIVWFSNKEIDDSELKSYGDKNNISVNGFLQSGYFSGLIGYLVITDFFAKRGYSNIFILHNDMFVIRDFRESFFRKKKSNWSFICPYVRVKKGGYSPNFEELRNSIWNSWQLKESSVRLSVPCIIFNPYFVSELYSEFGSWEKLWKNLINKFSPFLDLALFDITNKSGYIAKPILSPIVSQLEWGGFSYNGDFVESLIKDNRICFVHSNKTQNYLLPKISDLLYRIKERNK